MTCLQTRLEESERQQEEAASQQITLESKNATLKEEVDRKSAEASKDIHLAEQLHAAQ